VSLDRPGRAAEQVGDLRLRQVLEEAQHQHRALPAGRAASACRTVSATAWRSCPSAPTARSGISSTGASRRQETRQHDRWLLTSMRRR
jgi:hypothetical protein